MIRINSKEFDEKAIEKIYGVSGQLVDDLEKRIEQEYKNGTTSVKNFLSDWFFKDGVSSKEMISKYLLDFDTRGKINAFAQIICEIEWGSKELGDAFIRYHAFAKKTKQATESDPRSAELEALANSISERHVRAQMFEIVVGSTDGPKYHCLGMNDVQAAIGSGKRITLNRGKNKEIESVLAACKEIFNYNWFARKYRDEVLNAIGIGVCPYCNRQYITPFWSGGEKRNTGDVEHFYDKSTYPFLALSLYNFVPSCQICNSRFKGTKDFYITPHVNPYNTGFGSKARFQIENIDALIDTSVEPAIRLAYDPNDEEICNSVETFYIKELYENHLDYAKEIIKKSKVFTETQLEEYVNEYGGLFASKSELYRTIYGNYLDEENQGKRPLAKLTQDLLYDLNVTLEDV